MHSKQVRARRSPCTGAAPSQCLLLPLGLLPLLLPLPSLLAGKPRQHTPPIHNIRTFQTIDQPINRPLNQPRDPIQPAAPRLPLLLGPGLPGPDLPHPAPTPPHHHGCRRLPPARELPGAQAAGPLAPHHPVERAGHVGVRHHVPPDPRRHPCAHLRGCVRPGVPTYLRGCAWGLSMSMSILI